MKAILLILCILIIPSCKFGCTVEKIVVTKLSGVVANSLQCKNLAAIETDMKKFVGKVNLCKEDKDKEGPIALFVCPLVAEAAVLYLGSKIPQQWDCNPVNASKGVYMAVLTACNLLPF